MCYYHSSVPGAFKTQMLGKTCLLESPFVCNNWIPSAFMKLNVGELHCNALTISDLVNWHKKGHSTWTFTCVCAPILGITVTFLLQEKKLWTTVLNNIKKNKKNTHFLPNRVFWSLKPVRHCYASHVITTSLAE
jgi:hypothetical protein